MEELLKSMKELTKSFDKVMKEEIGYTMDEMLKLDGEKFEKVSDEFVNKLLKKAIKGENEITKADVKEKEHGQFLKIYEVETPRGEGVAVEGQGKLGDVIFMGAKGLGQVIKENRNCFKDLDDLLDTVCEQIRDEAKGGNR